jgi:acyl-CoA synthetase (AMP-forming)/AMP-acid ligase II/acyl carrier protein
MVSHYNVMRLFQATQDWFHFDQSDVWTLFHSYAFDFSVWEMWGALLNGGKLVIVPYWTSRNPEAFIKLLAHQGVTVLNQTPSAFMELLGFEAFLDAWATPALRWIIFGGEALNVTRLRPWFERRGDERPRLVNMYGITETTVHVTYRPLDAKDLESGRSVIGEAIPDLQIYVLDANLQPVPIGVVGEIYVGGGGVSQGYFNRPYLTAQRFVPDPFSKNGGLLYRSGDLARLLPDGDLEYLGRGDQQVKLRGFRIELGEIEIVLSNHPAVRQAVVLLRDDLGDGRLVAYIVADSKVALHPDELRTYLKDRLPEYMIPSALVFIEKFPLTPNGKLDRTALPKPPTERPRDEGGIVFPHNELEDQLCQIWEQVLGVQPIGVHDNFFDLGGHSLLAIKIVSRIRSALQFELPLRALFDAQTVSRLAIIITEMKTMQEGIVDTLGSDLNGDCDESSL